MARKSSTNTPKKSARKKSTPKKYVVEKVLDKRGTGRNFEYLIKWKNYPQSENSWEPAKNCDCPDLIKQFEKEQKTSASAKKRPAPNIASRSSNPPSKRSRTAPPGAENEEDAPRASRTSTTPTSHLRSRTTNAGIINLTRNRRTPLNVPTLVSQQVNTSADASATYSTSDEREETATAGAGIDETNAAAVASSGSASPEVKPVVTRCNITIANDGNDALTDNQELSAANLPYQKLLKITDNNIKMVQELIKCPDLFYVCVSLGILKDNLDQNRSDLLAEIRELQKKDDTDADELDRLTTKTREIKNFYDEVDTVLQNLHPSSRLDHVSPPQDCDDNRDAETISRIVEAVKAEPRSPTKATNDEEETPINQIVAEEEKEEHDTTPIKSHDDTLSNSDNKDAGNDSATESLPELNNENLGNGPNT